MFKFTSLSSFLSLQFITNCFFSPALSSAISAAGTLRTSFDGFSPADESSAFPVPVKGQCLLECQRHAGCQGFFFNDVSKMCITVTSESDLVQTGSGVSGFRYYINKYTCPAVTTTTNLTDLVSSQCYTVNDMSLLWDDARDHCSSTGGQLAVLDTPEKAVFIMNAMYYNYAYTSLKYHLGARRPPAMSGQPWPVSGQDFVWLNGQPLDVALGHWAAADPNNQNLGDDFIQLHDYPRLWTDGPDSAAGHICQYSLV